MFNRGGNRKSEELLRDLQLRQTTANPEEIRFKISEATVQQCYINRPMVQKKDKLAIFGYSLMLTLAIFISIYFIINLDQGMWYLVFTIGGIIVVSSSTIALVQHYLNLAKTEGACEALESAYEHNLEFEVYPSADQEREGLFLVFTPPGDQQDQRLGKN